MKTEISKTEISSHGRKIVGTAAVCQVCPHHCRLMDGQYGRCGARKNENGKIICDNYGKVTALALDPIEKKPLRHFFPGSMILSVGSYGCNLSCPFCQNHEISMIRPGNAYTTGRAECAGHGAAEDPEHTGWRMMRPEEIADLAEDCRLVHEHGMKNVLVTNGTAKLPVLEELLPYIDAMNIDLKGFTEEYYRKLGGSLETVKEFIRRAAKECHVELTTLIVPGENDSAEEMEREAEWIASVDPEIVLHVTRFFPRYRMTDRKATDVGEVYRLRDAAGKYLKYVYTGNC